MSLYGQFQHGVLSSECFALVTSVVLISRTAMRIHVSNSTYMALASCNLDYVLIPRGEMTVKVRKGRQNETITFVYVF